MTGKSAIYLGLILMLSLLIGCASRRSVITVAPSAVPSRISSPMKTIQPPTQRTDVLTEPTITIQPLERSVLRSKELLQTQCLTVNLHFTKNKEITQNLFITNGNTPFIFDVNNNTQTELHLPAQIARQDYFVSPDGRWLAYQDYHGGKDYLVVASLTNSREKLLKPNYKWSHPSLFYVQGWFSQNSLLLTRWAGDKEYPTAEISTVILNPFTNEEKEFNLEDYPGYKRYKAGGVGSYLFGHSNLLPDPTLTRMVYPEVTEGMYYITLWDLEQQKPVVRLDFFHENITNDPLWSQDGQDFLIRNLGLDPQDGIEWFQGTREGYVRQLTHFGMFSDRGFFEQASRSWDGRYLAFKWEYPSGEIPENRFAKYFVIDLKSPDLEGFCIDAVPSSSGELPPPVWSIDNRFMVISNSNNGLGNLILVDVENRKADQIAKDVIARGWVTHP